MSDIKNEIQAKLGELTGVRIQQADAKKRRAEILAAFEEEYGYKALNARESELADEIRTLAIEGYQAGEKFTPDDGIEIQPNATEIVWKNDLALMYWLAQKQLLWVPKVNDDFEPVYEPLLGNDGKPVTLDDGTVVPDLDKPVYTDFIRVGLRASLGAFLRSQAELGLVPGVKVVRTIKAQIIDTK